MYFIDVGYTDGVERHSLGEWSGYAGTRRQAESEAMKALWEPRLEASGCAPDLHVEVREDEVDLVVDDVVDELIRDLDNCDRMSEMAWKVARETIEKSRDHVRRELEHTWRVWADVGMPGDDHDIAIVFIFDTRGFGSMDYCGGMQMWQGASMGDYPYRAVVGVPDSPENWVDSSQKAR